MFMFWFQLFSSSKQLVLLGSDVLSVDISVTSFLDSYVFEFFVSRLFKGGSAYVNFPTGRLPSWSTPKMQTGQSRFVGTQKAFKFYWYKWLTPFWETYLMTTSLIAFQVCSDLTCRLTFWLVPNTTCQFWDQCCHLASSNVKHFVIVERMLLDTFVDFSGSWQIF